ncbi:MAG: dihydrodipicolinate synthase family protein, partial [Chloroflexi bacterium]|nr:dihydrodipicolinate synthase family protein [Chloroflexota bacterium]
APFNRYQTLEVARAVAEAGRASDIALYTGNDDNILLDLVTEYAFGTGAGTARVRIVGGLLGHWACWTKTAVDLLEEARKVRAGASLSAQWLTTAMQVTDCNAAFFDARNSFKGSIAGIHEVLRRQGLMGNTLCLDPGEGLSPGQAEEIDRVYRAYPNMNDDTFVAEHLEDWLG